MNTIQAFKLLSYAFAIFAVGYVLGIIAGEDHALLKVRVNALAKSVIEKASAPIVERPENGDDETD